MINIILLKKELKRYWKILVVFMAVLTLYISIIIGMFDPEMASVLKQFEKVMPNLMAAVGMTGNNDTLINFMISYLYGFILLVFPMIFSFLVAEGLICRYVEDGSMASLLAAPVKRQTIVFTQLTVLFIQITIMILYCTFLELIVANLSFPGALDTAELLFLNFGLWLFQIMIATFTFLCSCYFNESHRCLFFGAGIPVLMYIIQMLSNVDDKIVNLKYLTVFSLFDPDRFITYESFAYQSLIIMFLAVVLMTTTAICLFKNKDIHV